MTGTAEDPMASSRSNSGLWRYVRPTEVESAPTIIPIIRRLINLTKLNLSCIYLDSLPFPQLTKLQQLVLNDCFLAEVPEWVSNLRDLTALSVEGWWGGVHTLNYREGSYPSLTELNIEWQDLRGPALTNAAELRAAIEERAA